uniref:DNA-binding domain-containing protein n=1 Tax=Candidatus Kentrum sp. LFY TaxID=2126342 RepID=A0A450UFW2_9GAMM|nr:MAG: Putative DNA-binding domain-containing protein [Candidatus Kentron sp. LFY]
MSTILPIDIRRLMYLESSRVELKASWDEKTTGLQVIHTVCAFANDYQNLGGGYILIGVTAPEGRAVLPPVGLDFKAMEGIQKWIRGKCKTLDPEYQPVMSPEHIEGKHVLVIWAPGSETCVHPAHLRAIGNETGALERLVNPYGTLFGLGDAVRESV